MKKRSSSHPTAPGSDVEGKIDTKILTLRNLRLSMLAPEHLVFSTDDLTGINLTENELVTLPKWVQRWQSLVILDLSFNKLVRCSGAK
jgi:hypothetical protein